MTKKKEPEKPQDNKSMPEDAKDKEYDDESDLFQQNETMNNTQAASFSRLESNLDWTRLTTGQRLNQNLSSLRDQLRLPTAVTSEQASVYSSSSEVSGR